ncbi:MAG: multicopper oxidase family protein [Actinomycetota bacterium]|nr:multicopper oxidase family protein [Actinomycetota bacterium]
MRDLRGRTEAGWSGEAAIYLFAVLLAFGTLAWMEVLHANVLVVESAADSSHFVRDGLMLLPLSLAAALWGLRPHRRESPGLPRAAAATATAFAVLLTPAAAAHIALHDADERAVAHAGPGGATAPEMAEESHGLASTLLHGVTDAMLALPVAFLLSLGALALLRRRSERTVLTAAPRRRLLLTASTLVVAGAAAIVPVSAAVSPDYPKFAMPLVIPPTLTGQNINLTMAESQQQILPGDMTRTWTYNGSFPGPTIRRPTGVPTNVTITNNLPESAGSMSTHHHGAQTTEDSDGQPSDYLIPPGASKTYTYPAVDSGGPERAAPQWYHDHRDMVTGRNVWMGLAGAFIYDDPFEESLNLPKGEYDIPLMVADRQFDAGNQIPYTFLENGVFGDVILVNGVPQPFHDVGARRYRFRLYNISNKREYRFRLSNGQSITQIGTDSGLLPEPVSRDSILLGPAERADVVIDFAGRRGENIVLENADAAFGPGERDGEVMQFRVGNEEVTDTSSPVPAALRPLPPSGPPVLTRTWNFDRTNAKWTINAKSFDPNRVDAQPTLGTTERWVFRNPTSQTHLVHVHLNDQKLVSRNGQPPPAHERLKEVWHVEPGEEVVVDIPFSDYTGKFVIHCHVLEHEDDGMMTQFQTLPSGGHHSPPPSGSPKDTLSRKIRILSSKRLRRILRRGLRFEAAAPVNGATLRATMKVRGRTVGSVRRTRLSRGRVKVTLKVSRRGKARLRPLVMKRRRLRTVLKVRAGGETRRARFIIRR